MTAGGAAMCDGCRDCRDCREPDRVPAENLPGCVVAGTAAGLVLMAVGIILVLLRG